MIIMIATNVTKQIKAITQCCHTSLFIMREIEDKLNNPPVSVNPGCRFWHQSRSDWLVEPNKCTVSDQKEFQDLSHLGPL